MLKARGMMRDLGHCVRGLIAAATLLAPAARARGQGAWWNYQWPYRRLLSVKDVPKTALPGEEVGVVTMPTGGLTRPDARDVRVTTGSGRPVPHRVLMVGPGDRMRVAFALRAGMARYYAYFGNAEAPAPRQELSIRRGVLLETWANPGGVPRSLPQARAILDKAGTLIGRDFRDRMFLGHNPFGPQAKVCSVFTGWVVCRRGGEHQFSTSSQHASFLTVDGKLVVANGGRHRPQRRAVRTGRAVLEKGLHELKLYHVSAEGDPVAMAAWRPPGSKRLWAIPPGAFAPIRRAAPEAIQQYGKTYQADFIPVHTGESFMANRYFQRYLFKAEIVGRHVTRPQYRWEFGDGQTSSSASCDHVYLADGPFKVTLTVTVAGQTLTRTNLIHVTRPWDRVTDRRLEPLGDHADVVSGYDFARLDAGQNGRAVALLDRAGRTEALLRAGDALVKRDAAPDEVLREAVPAYAEALAADGQAGRAVAALLKGAEMARAPDVAAQLMVAGGRAALDVPDAEKAMAIFTRALKEYSALTTHEAIRKARIGVGDVWRLRGDYAKAEKAYAAAGHVGKLSFEKRAVRKGDLARHAEDYIREKQFDDASDFLDRLEYEFPAEKLEGFSTLLRVRLELARRRPAAAAGHAERLVRVNPRSNYAPELLKLAARAYEALGKGDAARRSLQRIVEGYPESPLAAEAARALAGPTTRPSD